MKMWEIKCSSCGKMTPANQCPQLMMTPLCKPCWVDSKKNKQYTNRREDLRRSDQRCQFCWNQPPLDVSGGTASYSGVNCQNVRVQKMPHSKHSDKCIVIPLQHNRQCAKLLTLRFLVRVQVEEFGRLTQRKSSSFTRKMSLVRSQYCPLQVQKNVKSKM